MAPRKHRVEMSFATALCSVGQDQQTSRRNESARNPKHARKADRIRENAWASPSNVRATIAQPAYAKKNPRTFSMPNFSANNG